MDNTIKIITDKRMHFGGKDTPAGTEVEVPPITALDVVNARAGRLVDPQDAQRLRRWATAQGARRDFTTGIY
jgi:hypothetical protein